MSVYLQSWSKRFSTSYMQQIERKTYSLNHGLVSCEKLTIHLFLDHSFSFNVKTDFTLNVKLVSQNLFNKLRKRMDGKKEGLINFDLLNGLNFNISSLQAQHRRNEANTKCQKLEFNGHLRLAAEMSQSQYTTILKCPCLHKKDEHM